MQHFKVLQFLLLFTFNINVVSGNSLCVSLQVNSAFEKDEKGCNFTVAASIQVGCAHFEDEVDFVKVFKGSTPGLAPPFCIIWFNGYKCSSAVGCACNNDTGIFFVTKHMTSSYIEELLLMGVLSDGDKFHTPVKLHPEDCAKTSTFIPSGFPTTNFSGLTPTPVTVSSDLTSSLDVTTFGDGENYTSFALTPARVLPEQRLVVILGSIGCGLLFLVGISIVFNAVMRKRRVGDRSGKLPPPPAPHSVRRAAGDDMMICGQPPPLPDRPTFVSAHVNDYADYAEIPVDTEPRLSNKDQTTPDSSPVSDSSMSDDCLHNIACPSSDSSLSEDYLHPVASASKRAKLATATESSSFKEAGEHKGYPPVRGKKPIKKSSRCQT